MAIVARNLAAFGLSDVELDPAVSFDKVSVRAGVSLQSVALAAGTSTDKVAELNPQLVANRAPPVLGKDEATWVVRVPPGTAPKAAKSLPKFAEAEAKVERYVIRWGESIEDIAARHHTTRGLLASLNGLRRDEVMRPGTVLLVPAPRPEDKDDPFLDVTSKPVVVVPAQSFSYPDRRRVFYRVVPGDTLRDVAALFGVTTDEICRWNAIDPAARVHDGMALQVYAPKGPVRPDVLALEEKEATVLPVGSPEFFAHFEGQRGRTRLEVAAKQGDTWRTLARRYGLSVAQLERINGRGRGTALNPGDKVVVYVAADKAPPELKGAKPPHAEEKAPEQVAVTRPIDPAPAAADDAAPKDEAKPVVMIAPAANAAAGPAVGKGEAAANR
jgi:membrane-bound lytic murein transglycosylase D